ncbi:MAG TPA: hypothetical protein VK002_06745 [Rubricoccaceae bacterium]|nr:hypothetical protein [Rubricoccaceae bacterium]
MIRTALAASCLLLVPLALGGCDALEAQDAFEQDASKPPSGIARTDAQGNLISDDPDDWRTAPLYATSFFRVATRPYPNPVSFSGGQPVNILVTTGDAIPGGLRIVAYKGGLRRVIPGAQCDVPGPVACSFSFFPSEIAGAQPGDLWRLVLFDGQSNVVTYGDLQIES